ncbi:MAG: L-serine ammonia-lyase, iron-sulfur-dependent subunit beta [Spirochaetaceae bacterium]|jgi:L-serine dehydratase|nr:L-serine ammonia-lyase, iron-sulfur-dependent subunit beta [Spirochaetaceae bacterium]
MSKEYVSLFEIFGPVMIGPSSSHTAGIGRISFLAGKIYGSVPQKAVVSFYGSLASTWKGHSSGDAAVAGLLGIPPEDERLFRGRAVLKELQAQGKGFPIEIRAVPELPPLWHPNTAVIELIGFPPVPGGRKTAHNLRIRGSSIGGGSIRIDEINGYRVNLSGELEAMLVLHHDEIGVIAIVSHILAAEGINIAGTSSHRKEKGDEALLVVEIDGSLPQSAVDLIQALPPIYQVIRFPSLGGL